MLIRQIEMFKDFSNSFYQIIGRVTSRREKCNVTFYSFLKAKDQNNLKDAN